ncbi:MAG: hypothetical protein HY901_02985 [Deltaproteobacteria bacterium]|nr:hypothetical protein [Deltaproteobacteria bacterium]
MSSRRRVVSLLVFTVLAILASSVGCLEPVDHVRSRDTGLRRDAGSPNDAGPAGDGSCPACLPACPPTCDADAGCPWTATPVGHSACDLRGISLTTRNDVGAQAALVAASYCACDLAMVALVASGPPLAWSEAEVAATGCSRTSLSIGPTGARTLLLTDPTGGLRLLESTRSGAWVTDQLREIRAPAALALDEDGNPHIAGLGQGAIVLASRVGKRWVLEGVATAPSLVAAAPVLIALGPDGQPRVAFSEGEVKLATKTASGWEVSTAPGNGVPVSLVVDAGGRAHLLYLAGGLRYGVMTASGWVSEPIEPKATAGSLALGPGGCPRAAWTSEGRVWFGERTESGWTAEHLADGTFGVAESSLALLPDGRPLILPFGGGGQLSLYSR